MGNDVSRFPSIMGFSENNNNNNEDVTKKHGRPYISAPVEVLSSTSSAIPVVVVSSSSNSSNVTDPSDPLYEKHRANDEFESKDGVSTDLQQQGQQNAAYVY